jgi:hypothetical protein
MSTYAILFTLIQSMLMGPVQPAVKIIVDNIEQSRYPVRRKVPMAMIRFIEYEFDLHEGSVDDIVYVARRVKPNVSPILLASILLRESYGGDPGTVRYCVKWKKTTKNGKTKWKCPEQYSCKGCWGKGHKNKKTGKFYSAAFLRKEGIDLGRWQLRHNPHGWSWLRFYGKKIGKKVSIDCAFDRKCARRAMIEAVNDLDKTRARKCRKPRFIDEAQWIGGWNRCGSYAGHVERYLKLKKKYKKWLKVYRRIKKRGK